MGEGEITAQSALRFSHFPIFPFSPFLMPALEFADATIRFGGLTAVAPLTFAVPVGQMAAIIGPNGAGKTTVFNLITGVYAPSGGEIFIGEERVASPGKSLRPHQLARLGVARTFQNIRLFGDLSVEENVRCAFAARNALAGSTPYGLPATIARGARQSHQEKFIAAETARLLEIFGLSHRAQIHARHLPYGQQRRLEIARALATAPKILLLDEPTSGMNPSETESVTAMISKARKEFDLTILLIEHHMSVVMSICERVMVLDGGVKIADDAPAAIQKNPHVIAAYLGEPDEVVDEAIKTQHAVA
jgi:branched-chain amino acid transport system ATP-binding protein